MDQSLEKLSYLRRAVHSQISNICGNLGWQIRHINLKNEGRDGGDGDYHMEIKT